MNDRLLVAKVAEFALSVTRTYLNGQPRTPERDRFYFHVLDVVHNVPVWLARDEYDPYGELLRYIGYAPADVQRWLLAEVERCRSEQSPSPG